MTDSRQDYGIVQFNAAVGLNFGNITTQIDLGGGGYDGESFGNPSTWTLHAGYMLPGTPGLELGVFYGENDFFFGDPDPFYGIEGRYASGPIAVEAALGTYEDSGTGTTYFDFVTVDAVYDVTANWSALGQVTVTDNSLGGIRDLTIVGLGAQYQTDTGMFVQASYHNMSGDYHNDILELKIGYDFGAGVTYDNRGWHDLLITF